MQLLYRETDIVIKRSREIQVSQVVGNFLMISSYQDNEIQRKGQGKGVDVEKLKSANCSFEQLANVCPPHRGANRWLEIIETRSAIMRGNGEEKKGGEAKLVMIQRIGVSAVAQVSTV